MPQLNSELQANGLDSVLESKVYSSLYRINGRSKTPFKIRAAALADIRAGSHRYGPRGGIRDRDRGTAGTYL
jgi:hypothetical protein